MNKNETMAQLWDVFAAAVIPDVPADANIYIGLQTAFYSGAYSLFMWIMIQMDDDVEPTTEDFNKINLMHAELEAFMAKTIAGGRLG